MSDPPGANRAPTIRIAVVGGGPAGLRAAEVAAAEGARVTLLDAQRSVGRKFLVAGKSGLNLTHHEDPERFLARYDGGDLPRDQWRRILARFDPEQLRAWALLLGIESFVASSGKVFPRSMKAAPLLRAWIRRLRELGVEFAMRHRLHALEALPLRLRFATADGERVVEPDAAILALGGASWPQTGSDGRWVEILEAHGIAVSPLNPANCGWQVDWPASFLAEAEGKPLKNIVLSCQGAAYRGEVVITKYGLEGGPLYHLGPVLRDLPSPMITLDLKPDLSLDEVRRRLRTVRSNYVREARRRLNLGEVAVSLLRHLPNLGPWRDPDSLARTVKACPLPLGAPRPLAEAISTAGGVAWSALDEDLMLRSIPGLFVAGEMIDWEAPTGGYLMQGCFASGDLAARSAVRWAATGSRP